MTEGNAITDKNKISVIVPIFRVERYLERCIKTLIQQTYKNLEIILIDDGSDDDCPVICDRYAGIDSRIKVVHQKNQGIADARNAGLAQVTGDYITFVDPDDYISPYVYENMMAELVQNEADMVMWNYKYVYRDDVDPQSLTKPENPTKTILNGRQAIIDSYGSYDKGVLFSVLWNKLCKKELFEGIKFPSKRVYEDEARLCRVLHKAKKIVYIDYPYYFYHQHNKSIVGKEWSEKNAQLLDAYIDKMEFFAECGDKELYFKELKHLMHMFCYTQSKFKEFNLSGNVFKMPQGIRCRQVIKDSPSDYKPSGSLKLECCLFTYASDFYYVFWELVKGKSK
ncbi:MAG: glycosyltransferase [Butyrivibrio sp.]|nr:glycosyltransferase [Butyrivibrio sp.]